MRSNQMNKIDATVEGGRSSGKQGGRTRFLAGLLFPAVLRPAPAIERSSRENTCQPVHGNADHDEA